jgi:hypothetical protein
MPIVYPTVEPEIMAEVRGVDFPGGGYMMGSGNYVTTLRTVENYFPLPAETPKWNREHS